MPYVTSIERMAIERGFNQGYLQGAQRGEERGRLEGKLEGKLEGQAALLGRQLIRRFGPLPEATQQRLHQATLEQLAHWADRILDARTLDEIFEEH